MSDRDDLQADEKEKMSDFTVIDEVDEKPKSKGKPKRYYLPDHLVVNTKLLIGVIGLSLLIISGLVFFTIRSAPDSQSGLMIYPRPVTAIPDSLAPVPTATYAEIIIPTPTMRFDSQFQNWTYPVILTREIGGIPANTRVTIHNGHFNGTEWIYGVTPEMGGYLEVPESALAQEENFGTPIVVTPGALFNDLIGLNVYWTVTTDQVGDIPRDTLVRVSTAFFDGSRWSYEVASEGNRLFARAEEWQLAFAPGVTPGAPTPIAN